MRDLHLKFLSILSIWILWTLLSFLNEDQQIEYSEKRPAAENVITILGWGPMNMEAPHDELWFRASDPDDPFRVCYDNFFSDPAMKCIMLNNMSRINESDAVIFRGRRMSEMPLPSSRIFSQYWIFFEMEPPHKVYTYTNLTAYKDIFNLTATYSSDSDFPHDISISKCTIDTELLSKMKELNFAANKTRKVAWMASICETQSNRQAFVRKLRRYITVDVYGSCGELNCTKTAHNEVDDECIKTLLNGSESYKFYLAFENSFCHDYLTEKLWKLRNLNVVPVVMGGVDYSNILPPKSFIDVRNFRDPKKLAYFLSHLDENDNEYNEYVARWRSIECAAWYRSYMPWQCRICEGLHQLKGRKRQVHDLTAFWGTRQCMSPEQYFNAPPHHAFEILP